MVRVCIGCNEIFGCSSKDALLECRTCKRLCEPITGDLPLRGLSQATGGICSVCWLNWRENKKQKPIRVVGVDTSTSKARIRQRNTFPLGTSDGWGEETIAAL